MELFVGEYLLGRTRWGMLRELLQNRDRSWSVFELQARSQLCEAAVRRELNALTALGLLTVSRPSIGPRRYQVVHAHPVLNALVELVFGSARGQ